MATFKSCKASLSEAERISFVDQILSAPEEFKVRLPFLDTCCIAYILCDGNSLYAACSILLCGKDELHVVLRELTSTKLFTNQEFYSIHILNLFSIDSLLSYAT